MVPYLNRLMFNLFIDLFQGQHGIIFIDFKHKTIKQKDLTDRISSCLFSSTAGMGDSCMRAWGRIAWGPCRAWRVPSACEVPSVSPHRSDCHLLDLLGTLEEMGLLLTESLLL